ncbi:MAG: nitrate- and nitrite sensing domain-containing protein [Sulfurimonas sp.]|jgi:gas vesicle protein|nr:nitrate- and nitrite sensing domain-containing protein [Sulfurimonas sp.]
MISIRIRIFFLALITVSAMTAAFYIEYNNVHKKLNTTNNAVLFINEIHSISELIHTLQKERGLTAALLSGNNIQMQNLLIKQRAITESTWDKLTDTELLQDGELFTNLHKQIVSVRQHIDSKKSDWNEVKEQYTSAIQNLLEQIVLKVSSVEYSEDISYELHSLYFLANARENLGLVRATINLGYTQGKLSIKDFGYVNNYYGVFIYNLRIFKSISKTNLEKTHNSAWLSEIENEAYLSGIRQTDR